MRGKLTFKFELQPDAAANRMDMKISGGGFGSALDLTAGADLVDAWRRSDAAELAEAKP